MITKRNPFLQQARSGRNLKRGPPTGHKNQRNKQKQREPPGATGPGGGNRHPVIFVSKNPIRQSLIREKREQKGSNKATERHHKRNKKETKRQQKYGKRQHTSSVKATKRQQKNKTKATHTQQNAAQGQHKGNRKAAEIATNSMFKSNT